MHLIACIFDCLPPNKRSVEQPFETPVFILRNPKRKHCQKSPKFTGASRPDLSDGVPTPEGCNQSFKIKQNHGKCRREVALCVMDVAKRSQVSAVSVNVTNVTLK